VRQFYRGLESSSYRELFRLRRSATHFSDPIRRARGIDAGAPAGPPLRAGRVVTDRNHATEEAHA